MPKARGPPITLAALSFPHIIDGIFAAAPLASLLVMRQTCRAWRERADAIIGYALELGCDAGDGGGGAAVEVEVRTGLVGARLARLRGGALGRALLADTPLPWAAHARVVDCHRLRAAPFALLAVWPLPALETVRFFGAPHGAPGALAPLLVTRAVCFPPVPPPRPRGDPRRAFPVLAATKVVLNLDGPTRTPATSRYPDARRVAVVLHPWDAPLAGPEEVRGGIWAAVGGNLGEAWAALRAQALEGERVALVGLEALPPAALGLAEQDLDGTSVQEVMAERLECLWEAEPWVHRCDACLAWPDVLAFKTREQYRAEIGWREFEIETQRTISHSPVTLNRGYYTWDVV